MPNQKARCYDTKELLPQVASFSPENHENFVSR